MSNSTGLEYEADFNAKFTKMQIVMYCLSVFASGTAFLLMLINFLSNPELRKSLARACSSGQTFFRLRNAKMDQVHLFILLLVMVVSDLMQGSVLVAANYVVGYAWRKHARREPY